MQIGKRQALDAARNALRDRFDALWLASSTIGTLEARAIKCALALDAPNYRHNRGNWVISPGYRFTGATNFILYA